MEKDIEEAKVGLKTALEAGRADVFMNIISTLREVECTHDIDFVEPIFSEWLCDEGTLLHQATKLKNKDIVRILLTAGAKPDIVNASGKTPLTYLNRSDSIRDVYFEELLQATAQSNVIRVNELLGAGLDVQFIDGIEDLNTPLHWAASYGDKNVIKCLCDHGAMVNISNTMGHTPLHEAIQRGDREVVEELLCYGADVNSSFIDTNSKVTSAMDLASHNKPILDMLRNPPVPYSTAGNTKVSSPPPSPSPAVPNGPLPDHLLTRPLPNGHIPSANEPQQATLHLKSPNFKSDAGKHRMSLLWPQPQVMIKKPGDYLSVPDKLTVFLVPGPTCSIVDVLSAWQRKAVHFESLGTHIEARVLSTHSERTVAHVICHVNSRLCNVSSSYKIVVLHNQIRLMCYDIAGLNHAISTLIQLFRVHKDDITIDIPQMQIEDWPEFRVRGVMFVVSDGRVPTLETLRERIETLSLMKINQIQLYCIFRSGEWCLSYSQSDLIELGKFCRDRCIELVPGLEVGAPIQYENIAEPYSVFSDYLHCFPDTKYVSIGPRLSSFLLSAAETLTFFDVYTILPISDTQTLMFGCQPLLHLSNEKLRALPPSILFMNYSIRADHDFREFASRLADTGLSFCCCSGTAAWHSVSGCPEAALSSSIAAVKCASTIGGFGVMVCDWSSGGSHLTYDCASWPAFILTAGFSWNSDVKKESIKEYLPDLLSMHVYNDEAVTIGRVLCELGNAETALLRAAHAYGAHDIRCMPDDHGSTLFQLLLKPDDVVLHNLSTDIFQKVSRHIKKCQSEVVNCKLKCSQSEDIVAEIRISIELMLYAIKVGRALTLMGRNPNHITGVSVINPGISNLQPTTKTDLANKLLEHVVVYQRVWGQRYLPSALQDSLVALQASLQQLVPQEQRAVSTQHGQ